MIQNNGYWTCHCVGRVRYCFLNTIFDNNMHVEWDIPKYPYIEIEIKEEEITYELEPGPVNVGVYLDREEAIKTLKEILLKEKMKEIFSDEKEETFNEA